MATLTGLIPEGVEGYEPKIAVAWWDFPRHGGAVGSIPLFQGLILPAGITISGGFVEVVTQPTSGGAGTIALQVEAANDLAVATAVSGLTVGRKNLLPTFTAGSLTANTAVIRTTTARDVTMVVGTAALTAGRIKVVLHYYEPLK